MTKEFLDIPKLIEIFFEMTRLQEERVGAFKEYIKDVEEKKFPAPDNLISMDQDVLDQSIKEIESMI